MAVDDGHWMDLWQRPDGDQVLLFVNAREFQQRQPGWSLITEYAYDYAYQMAADGATSAQRGLISDLNPMPSGPTAYFPAPPPGTVVPG